MLEITTDRLFMIFRHWASVSSEYLLQSSWRRKWRHSQLDIISRTMHNYVSVNNTDNWIN